MPKIHFDDTITAIATPPGEGGIAVIRLSGPEALAISQRFFRSNGTEVRPQFVYHGTIQDKTSQILDEVLLTYFCAPRSYTGEDVVEISCHGGTRICRSIIELLIDGGARLAEPGEFTRRAFLNGRIDLVQAEAVLDVIRAKTDSALAQAERQLRGELSQTFREIKADLLNLLAAMEAEIDFPEEDKEAGERTDFKNSLSSVEVKIKQLLKTKKQGAYLREGMCAAIVGKPNVGKSSLLNKLLQKERAIVTDIPGTTRDTIEEWVEIHGFPVKLIDTAGITPTQDPVERIGVERTRQAIEDADIILLLLDGSEPFGEKDRQIAASLPREKERIICITKTDLEERLEIPKDCLNDDSVVRISALKNTGLDELEERILSFLEEGIGTQEGAMVTNARHALALESALTSVTKVRRQLEEDLSIEFIAEDLKVALRAVGEIVGEVYTEDLLGVIFSRFCIGK